MLKKFVLWGHCLHDYMEMFNLTEEMLAENKIIEYGAGVTSFNREMTDRQLKVTSIDPMYRLSLEEIKAKANSIFDTTVLKIKQNKDKYNWKTNQGLKELLEKRRQGMEIFYNDYEQGKSEGRYVVAEEGAALDCENYSFDLALITHHLFVNFGERGVEAHISLIKEMIRVAGEVRIFPLLSKNGQVSKLLGPVMLNLQQQDIGLEVRQVASQLQKSGNAMLRAWAVKCEVS